MEGTWRLAGVVAEAVARLEELVLAQAALWGEGDLMTVERQLQQVLRQVGSVLVSGVLNSRAAGPQGEAVACPACGGRLHLVGRERPRAVLGLVGEYRFRRPTFHCAACHAGHAPLDEVLGLGDERLSPALAQVVCEQAQKDSFAGASTSVQSSLGAFVAAETVRRVAEAVGGLIEQDQADHEQWAVPQAAVPECLLVETDGITTPLLDGYHETKVGRVAALGPRVHEDPETGRATLALGPSTYCVGLERGEDFFPRLVREACRAGLTRGVRRVVFLGDGAPWIWHQGHAQFGCRGVEVLEIVDFFHASEHLGEVATALYGQGTLQARTWWAEQRHVLLHQGVAPVLTALAACTSRDLDLGEAARDALRRNQEYFTTRAARMDYPAFIARHVPIGSGAIESACKQLITQREKGPGMRWSASGAHAIANLRALFHSAHARWATFWASRPLTRLRLLPPPAATPPPRTVAEPPPATARWAPEAPPAEIPAEATPSPAHKPPPAAATPIATAGKPWAKGPGYWRRSPVSHKRLA